MKNIIIEEAPVEKQDKGFTLVELLIVIVILGILATVTVFAVRGITDQGQTAACSADRKTLETAIEAYYAQTGNDPIEADLTPEFMRSESVNYNVGTGGAVVLDTAVNPNPCT